MCPTQDNRLRDLLVREAKAVSEDAIQADGQVSAERVEALERLARLVEIHGNAQPSPPRKRWPLAAALGGTLLIASLLLFSRVSETEIELDLSLSEATFVLPRPQVLTDVMSLSALGISGLREVRLPRVREGVPQTPPPSERPASAIRLSVASEGERQGTITLATLPLPAKTRVRLHRTEVPHQYRVSLEGPGLDLRVNVNGPVRIGLSGTSPQQLDFTSPKSILLRPSSDEIDLDLTLPGPSRGAFSRQLLVTDLSFLRIDSFTDLDRTIVRPVSTLLSGTLYLESLNGRSVLFRPGEALHFEDVRGEIRTLQLHDDRIALKFHGRVRGMSVGWGDSRRSFMPTYLEWLRARHGLSLLWGSTLYVFGLIVGVLRWWRIPV